MKTIERNEFQSKKVEKRRQERKNREALTNLIRQLIKAREITHETKWRDFAAKYKDDPIYLTLVGQIGSTPHEIFDDAITEERDLLSMHKPSFKSLIKVSPILECAHYGIEQWNQVPKHGTF